MHQDSIVMENRPVMIPVKLDMYNKMSWRMTEFDMTSGMMENSIEITML
jgi:hypothetical protein